MTRRSSIAIALLISCAARASEPTGTLEEPGPAPSDVIEERVLDSVHRLYGGTSKVIARLPLTEPLMTRSRWELVVAKETDIAADFGDENPTTICFVHNGNPECTERTLFPIANPSVDPTGRLFYEFGGARVVTAVSGRSSPMLMITACSLAGGNGNCGKYTLLFDYDRSSDQLRLIFHDAVPRNNNGATRFMEKGPLQGDVVSVTPTNNAPYGYFVSVFTQDATGRYVRILRYRSKTHYNDGNRLAVVDSDMPELLRRFGLWKPTDPLPTPTTMPKDCTKLVLRKGEEWCE